MCKTVGSLGYPELENRPRKRREGNFAWLQGTLQFEQTAEAREGLKVCLLFPDTLFTVGWFPLEGPTVKGEVPSFSAG